MKKLILLGILLLFIYVVRENTTTSHSEFTLHQIGGLEMTVPYRILIGHPLDQEQIKAVEQKIAEVFEHTFQVYNKWNPNSELSKFNASQIGVEFPVSEKLYTLLKETDQMWKISGGHFDPTIESENIGWNNIQLSNGTVLKLRDLKLDLGGIAKGKTIDELTESLLELGHKNLLVEWGGDFRATGEHPSGRPWRLSIKNPFQGPNIQIDLINQALATSGDYEQFKITEDGRHLSHIIDPRTGQQLERKAGSIASASVFAKTCVEADAIATALMLFQEGEELHSWLKDHPEYSYHITFVQ